MSNGRALLELAEAIRRCSSEMLELKTEDGEYCPAFRNCFRHFAHVQGLCTGVLMRPGTLGALRMQVFANQHGGLWID
jgi:hypothetical protein